MTALLPPLAVPPNHITFTGLDARADLARAADLSLRYRIEWGVLMRDGTSNVDTRFPRGADLTRILTAPGLRLAAHLCGNLSRSVLRGMPIDDVVPVTVDRVQVNARSSYSTYERLAEAAEKTSHAVIAQSQNDEVFPEPLGRLTFLQDQSGGHGVLPARWAVSHIDGQFLGFAGGLDPDNVANACRAMTGGEVFRYWIDMESGVRSFIGDNVWLDLDKCEAVCRAVFGER